MINIYVLLKDGRKGTVYSYEDDSDDVYIYLEEHYPFGDEIDIESASTIKISKQDILRECPHPRGLDDPEFAAYYPPQIFAPPVTVTGYVVDKQGQKHDLREYRGFDYMELLNSVPRANLDTNLLKDLEGIDIPLTL